MHFIYAKFALVLNEFRRMYRENVKPKSRTYPIFITIYEQS